MLATAFDFLKFAIISEKNKQVTKNYGFWNAIWKNTTDAPHPPVSASSEAPGASSNRDGQQPPLTFGRGEATAYAAAQSGPAEGVSGGGEGEAGRKMTICVGTGEEEGTRAMAPTCRPRLSPEIFLKRK